MKKKPLLIIMMLTALAAEAQYQFSTLTDQSYTEISNPEYVIDDTSIYWGNVLTRPDMYFKAFGKVYDLYDGISIPLKQGYLFFTNATHSTTVYVAKGVFDARPGRNQQSSFSFKTELNGSKKTFIAQWKNLGFKNGDSSHFINFQLRLIEDGERIEFHFGPSNSKNGLYENNANGPTMGLLEMNQSFSTIYNQLWLSGNPHSAAVVNANGVVNLNGTPPNGTVYRFAYGIAGTTEIARQQMPFTIYPSPAVGDKLLLNWAEGMKDACKISIHDISGKLIIEKQMTPSDKDLPHTLQSGTYLVRISDQNTVHTQRIVVR